MRPMQKDGLPIPGLFPELGASALAEYYRMLSDENDDRSRFEALKSLNIVRHSATDKDMEEVEKTISNEPSVALTYAYYEIAKHPLSSRDFAGQSEKDEANENKKSQLRIADFATQLIQRYPKAATNAGFILRTAMAKFELGEYAVASHLANRVLQLDAQNEERDKALWVKGIADYQLGRSRPQKIFDATTCSKTK